MKTIKINKETTTDTALTMNRPRYPVYCETQPSMIAPIPIPTSNAVRKEAVAPYLRFAICSLIPSLIYHSYLKDFFLFEAKVKECK
ncbi:MULTISPECIES: hypothetical protein [Bacillus]|uniref:Uncharacterized protein n=1 Tax=Bacillus capparidis TaxID=1840411 RepID=A0ABS4CYU2_9BACI|nr:MULTISPECIES: hypothetical protein [Bacillus]MBP1082551.1 hypothetical protein [Bacillus capparidis]